MKYLLLLMLMSGCSFIRIESEESKIETHNNPYIKFSEVNCSHVDKEVDCVIGVEDRRVLKSLISGYVPVDGHCELVFSREFTNVLINIPCDQLDQELRK